MLRTRPKRSRALRGPWGALVLSLLVVAVLAVANPAYASTTAASDSLAGPDATVGTTWTPMTDGGLDVDSQVVTGTKPAGNSGDMYTSQNFTSDQYSQVQVTATPLSGDQWIGPAVRAQAGGQDLYLGLYFWHSGNPELMLFKRVNGNWSQLGSYQSGRLPAGTALKLTAVGNTIVFAANGVDRIAVGDSTFTGGAPGIMAYGTASAANWTGGNAGFEVDYVGTDSGGVESYNVISDNDGYGPQVLRVLRPTHPTPGVAHNFLYVLPVEAALGDTFGDGLETLAAEDAEDQYNLTIIEPSFYLQPWYANNPDDPNLQYDTFMTSELVPWVTTNFATSGTEQNWLIGFSKSGLGGQDLILRHPDIFSEVASWDFPADMSSYNEYSNSAANYGTATNFASNYQLSSGLLNADSGPFRTENRIWIGGYSLYGADMSDYDALLTSQGIAHTTAPAQYAAQRWDSGWMPEALAALHQDSLNLPEEPLSSSTSLTSSTDESTSGQPITLTATVSPSLSDRPTGTMTFTDGPITLCKAVPVYGQATCTVSTLTPGVHSILATYSGDPHYLPSTSDWLNQIVNQVNQTVTPSIAFNLRPGLARMMSVGPSGSVWILGTSPVAGGYPIYHWNGSGWTQMPGGAARIAVDPGGNPWVVNSAHRIYHWNGTGWVSYTGAATDISVGANGSLWVIGTDPVAGGYPIYHWNGTGWTLVAGGAVRIAVDPGGNPWVVNSAHRIYHWNGTGWVSYTGAATDISVGANGSLWVIGTDPVAGGYPIYHWNGTGWTLVAGGAVRIAVDPGGDPWVVNSAHRIYSS